MPRYNLHAPTGEELVEERAGGPDESIGLCLSGGGYRAMLFHLGALRRLNEAGYLPRLARVSSVSGGSITAGMLGVAWPSLAFDGGGVAQAFEAVVGDPIRRLASTTIDRDAILLGLLGPGTASDRIAEAYRKHLFGNKTLQDLPASGTGPHFVFNAANLQSGALWRFSREYARDWRVGWIPEPRIDVAVAVAASAAFPPFLSPAVLRLKESQYRPDPTATLHRPPYTTDVKLTDGGVYDNLGLETVWKNHRTVLVSDGGGRMGPTERPERNWVAQLRRVYSLTDNQVRSLRKRQVVDSYELPAGDASHREGAYWGIRSDIANYKLATALPCPFEATTKLAQTATRLKRLDDTTQKRLINWGYAICDAALRKHVAPALIAPADFPYPREGIG